MPVSVTLERAGNNDPAGYAFVVAVKFSETSTTTRTSRMLALVECTATDVRELYARATGEVLRALNISDWRRSRCVQQYTRRIRISLRGCGVCDLSGVFDECSRALHRAAARERGVRHGSRRSAIGDAAATIVACVPVAYPGACAGCVLAATANAVAAARTSENHDIIDAASGLPPAQRMRYLSLFV